MGHDVRVHPMVPPSLKWSNGYIKDVRTAVPRVQAELTPLSTAYDKNEITPIGRFKSIMVLPVHSCSCAWRAGWNSYASTLDIESDTLVVFSGLNLRRSAASFIRLSPSR